MKNLSEREPHLRELMDDPDCDPERLDATLRRFWIVNRLVAGWGVVYRTRLRSMFAALGREVTVLDIGSGAGDVIAHLAKLTARDGITAHFTGVDPDPRAHQVVQEREIPHATFRCTDAAELVKQGEMYDVVISNHVLHHIADDQLTEFAETSRQLATSTVLHSDIARGRLAYGLFAVGVTPLAPGTFLRVDGLRSIRRSYQPDELAEALGPDWQVHCPARFRVVAEAPGLGESAPWPGTGLSRKGHGSG